MPSSEQKEPRSSQGRCRRGVKVESTDDLGALFSGVKRPCDSQALPQGRSLGSYLGGCLRPALGPPSSLTPNLPAPVVGGPLSPRGESVSLTFKASANAASRPFSAIRSCNRSFTCTMVPSMRRSSSSAARSRPASGRSLSSVQLFRAIASKIRLGSTPTCRSRASLASAAQMRSCPSAIISRHSDCRQPQIAAPHVTKPSSRACAPSAGSPDVDCCGRLTAILFRSAGSQFRLRTRRHWPKTRPG